MVIAKLKEPYYLEGHVGVWAVLSIDPKSLRWKTFFPLWSSGSNAAGVAAAAVVITKLWKQRD